MPTDPLKERIALLEKGEAQRRLKPEHQAELDNYRRTGRAKAIAGTTLEMPKARDDARKGLATIERIVPILDRVEKLQRTQMSGTGLAGLKEYQPWRQANQEFDAAAAQLRMIARPATRTPGEGTTSDFESKLAVAAMPDRWAFDARNNESIRGLRELIATSRRQYEHQLGQDRKLPTAPPSARPKARPDASAVRKKYGL